jgi:hypothetical protein
LYLVQYYFLLVLLKGLYVCPHSEIALVKLQTEVEEILTGILLGDDHISRRWSTANSKLIYAQTAVTHKEYFYHVFKLFLPFCVNAYVP